MGTYSVPPLRFPEQPDLLGNFEKIQALRNMQQESQLRAQQMQNAQLENKSKSLELQQQQQAMQDLKTIQDTLQKAGPNATLGDVLPDLQGKIQPDTWFKMRQADMQMRQQTATLDKDALDNADKQHKAYQEIYNNAMNLPDDQFSAQWPQIAQAVDAVPGNKIPLDPGKPMAKEQLKSFGPFLSLNEAYLKAEMEKRKATAETGKAESEAAALKEFGGMTGPMIESKYVALQAKKNQGQPLSPEDEAFVRAYERNKTLNTQFKFNLEAGGAGNLALNPKQQATAQAILEGRMAPPSSFALRTPYWQTVMGAVFEQDPQFSEQRAQLRKDFTVGKHSTEINAINTAMGHVGVLGDAIDALNNNDVKVLNRIANAVGVQVGKDNVTTFNTIVHRVGPELTRAYVGSAAGEGERQLTERDFDPSLGTQQLKSNVGITARLLRSKIASLENQWNQNKGEGMKDFQEQFIMPEAKSALDKFSPRQAARSAEGVIYARDPQGVLHQAPAGTALPAGWKLENK